MTISGQTVLSRPALPGWGRLFRRAEIFTGLAFAISLLAVVPALAVVDFSQAKQAIALAGWPALGTMMAAAAGNCALRIGRFDYYLRRMGVAVPAEALALNYIAGFAMSLTPGKAGEVLRAMLLYRRHGVPYRSGLPAVVADRVADVVAVAALAIVGLVAFPGYVIPAAAMAIVFGAGTVLLAQPRLVCRLLGLLYAATGRCARLLVRLRRLIRDTALLFHPRPLAVGVGLGVLGWLLECAALSVCAQMLSPTVSFAEAIFVFSFATLVGGLTFLPGGIGGSELTMVVLLMAAGMPAAEAIVITTTARLGTLWFGVACGYAALLRITTRSGQAPRAVGRATETD